LIVRDLSDEVVIYDTVSEQGHCLNPTAASVWRLADGSRTPADIARLLSDEAGATITEAVVWYALEELQRDTLLEEGAGSSSDSLSKERMSRSNMLKLVGAAVAVPVIATVAASPAYAAGSCNSPCSPGQTGNCPHSICPNCVQQGGSGHICHT
jgi:hypothetical protein